MSYLKTAAVARELGKPYHVVYGLLRANKLSPPEKDSSGDFVWTPADVERARRALLPVGQGGDDGACGTDGQGTDCQNGIHVPS